MYMYDSSCKATNDVTNRDYFIRSIYNSIIRLR